MSAIEICLFVFAALGGIGGLAAALAWAGITPQQVFNRSPTMAPRWKLFIALSLFALSFLCSALALYLAMHQQPYFSDAITETIEGRSYVNEEVVLDGRKYVDCTFENVSFRYNGKASFQFMHNIVRGTYRISSGNPAVGVTVGLLKGMGMLKEGIPITIDNNKPWENVQAPSH